MTRDELIIAHMPLVKAIVGSLRRQYGFHRRYADEMTSDGLLGLVMAADRNRPELGDFGAFASQRIRGEIIDGLRNRHHSRWSSQPEFVPVRDTDHIETPDPSTAIDVQEALGVLKERDRSLLERIYWQGELVRLPGKKKAWACVCHRAALKKLAAGPLKAYERAA